MIDPRNLINLTGGVVTDVELINDKIAKINSISNSCFNVSESNLFRNRLHCFY